MPTLSPRSTKPRYVTATAPRWSFPRPLPLSAIESDSRRPFDGERVEKKNTRSIQTRGIVFERFARPPRFLSSAILRRDLPFIRMRARLLHSETHGGSSERFTHAAGLHRRRHDVVGPSILLLCTGRIHGGSHSTSRFLSSTHPHHKHNGALEKEHAGLKRRGGLPGPILDVCGPRSGVSRKATPPLSAHTLGSVSSVWHKSNNVGQRATIQHRSYWDKKQPMPTSMDADTTDVQACGVQEPTEVVAGRTLNQRTKPRPRRHIANIAPLLFRAIIIQRSVPRYSRSRGWMPAKKTLWAC